MFSMPQVAVRSPVAVESVEDLRYTSGTYVVPGFVTLRYAPATVARKATTYS